MDLHDWEFLDDGGFFDFHGDAPLPTSHPTTQFDMNYFTCPSPNSTKIIQPSPDFTPPRQPAQFQRPSEKTNILAPTPRDDDDDLLVKEALDSKTEPPAAIAAEADQDSVSRVFFAKMRENEFADMKLDSPKSEADEMLNSPRLRMGLKDSKTEPPAAIAAEADQDSVSRVFFAKTRENEFADMKLDSPKSEADEMLNSPRLRMGLKDSKTEPPAAIAAEADQDSVSRVFFTKTRENEFVDMKLDSPKSEADEMLNSPRLRMGLKKSIELDLQGQKEVIWEEDNGALKIWKWSMNGIGAICSFGIAAATICVIVLGSQHGHKHPQHTTHKLRFQIYSDDKRSKMNEAISGVRGVPMSRAQITTGGRYDAM